MNGDGAAVLRGDALAIPLGDETVDLIVTSPPYFALRSYQDGGEHYDGQIGSEPTPQAFLDALWAVTAECWRVLKPSGSLFVNLGDKYAGSANTKPHTGTASIAQPGQRRNVTPGAPAPKSDIRAKSLMGLPWRYAIGCIDGQADPEGKGWILRSEIVWSKPNGLPESVRDRVRRSHEQWFHMTKEPRYYADMDVVREPHATDPTARPTWEERKAKGEPMRAGLAGAAAVGNVGGMAGNPLGKLPDSVFVHDDLDALDMPTLPSDDSATVWRVATQPLQVPDSLGVDHFAAFPTEWPRRIIAAWSPSGYCTACGEPRRSTSTSDLDVDHVQRNNRPGKTDLATHTARVGSSDMVHGATRVVGTKRVTITGESCACSDTTAPTRPAVVLDPFGGTGTTAMVARALGRYGVSLDLSADYLRLAQWRIWESDGAARVQARTAGRSFKPAPPVDRDQLSLLDLTPSPLGADTR